MVEITLDGAPRQILLGDGVNSASFAAASAATSGAASVAAMQAATAAQGAVHTLPTSVSAGGALPFEVTALSGAFVGTGTGGTPGEYALTVSGGPAGHTAFITVGGDGKIASARIGARGIATANTAPTYALPSGTGLTGATLPTATVTALAAGRIFFAPNAAGTQKLAWQSSGGVIAAYNVGGAQWSEYFKTGVDAVVALPQSMYPVLKTRGGRSSGYTRKFVDLAGKVLAGSIERATNFMVITSGFRFRQPTVKLRSGKGPLVKFVSSNGKVAFQIDNDTGRAFLVPNAAAIPKWASLLGITGSGNTFRSQPTVTAVRSSTEMVFGRVTSGSWTGQVIQKVSGTLSTAIVDDPRPVKGFHAYGQSNAGKGGVAASVLTTALHPYHALMYSAGIDALGTSTVTGTTLADIIPMQDASDYPHLIAAVGFAFEDFSRRRGVSSPGALLRTDWYGGQPLTTFAQGTTTYNNLITSITRAPTVLAAYGRGYTPTIVFSQGESGATSGGAGSSQRSAWSSAATTLFNNIRADVQTAVGIVPPIIFHQPNWSNDWDNIDVDLAQVDVANAFLGTSVALSGPTYQCPLDGASGASPHYSATGRMMQGELTALVDRMIEVHGRFTPLLVKAVTRSGAVFTVDFYPPTGVASDGSASIQWDTDWLEAIASYGFYAKVASGGASLTVSSVNITGPFQVQVTLSSTPGSATRLGYARVAQTPAAITTAPRRGQLFVSSGIASPYKARGYTVPSVIRHYAVAFEVTVS